VTYARTVDRPAAVELVGPELVRPLRHAVLRPGRPADESVYPGDDDAGSAHAAVRRPRGDVVVAVGTVLPSAPWEAVAGDAGGPEGPAPGVPAWRIRGMATAAGHRGGGLGTMVLGTLLAHVAAHGGGLVWCNARAGARALYQRAGFAADGDAFDLPEIGPHVRMWRIVEGGGGGVGPTRPPVPT